MSDTEQAPIVDEQPVGVTLLGVTPGSVDLAPEQAEEPIAAVPLLCPICGHAESAHLDSGRCLIMLGEYGTEGPCPCPEPA